MNPHKMRFPLQKKFTSRCTNCGSDAFLPYVTRRRLQDKMQCYFCGVVHVNPKLAKRSRRSWKLRSTKPLLATRGALFHAREAAVAKATSLCILEGGFHAIKSTQSTRDLHLPEVPRP